MGQLLSDWIEDAGLPEKDVCEAFVDAEFVTRLRNYRYWGIAWRCAQILIWLAIALLGLLGSVLAATHTASIVAIVAGALVGILTTFSHAAHPGRQADGYEAAEHAMLDEAWALLNGIDPYEKAAGETGAENGQPIADGEAFKTFVKQIRTIVKRKRDATRISDLS